MREQKEKFNKFCDDTFGFGKERDVVDDFSAKFGLGRKYIPKEPTYYDCPIHSCGGKKCYYKEIHPDTDMDEIVLYCPDCGYESEG
jgi:hypothetical protein